MASVLDDHLMNRANTQESAVGAPTPSTSNLTTSKIAALLQAPAMNPPSGTQSVLDDSISLPQYVFPGAILLTVFCTLSFLVRIATRGFIQKKFGWDDCKPDALREGNPH